MSAYSDYVLSLNPLFYWDLAANGANDLTANNRDGTAQGGVSIGGLSDSPIYGETLSTAFDGTDDYVNGTYNPFVAGSVRTVIGWFYRTNGAAYHALFGTVGSNPEPVRCVFESGDPGVLAFNFYAGSDNSYWSQLFPSARWVLVGFVLDDSANTIKLYINGTRMYSADISGTMAFSASLDENFTVGAMGEPHDFYNGRIAHIAVTDDEVTASEHAELFRLSQRPTPSRYRDYITSLGPSLYWDMAENGVNDLSGNNRDGTSQRAIVGGYTGTPIYGETLATDFRGASDEQITCTYNPFSNGTNRTFMGWTWRDTTASTHSLMGSDGAFTNSLNLWLNSGNNTVSYQADQAVGGVTWTGLWPRITQWVFWGLVSRESANTAELYLNGKSMGSLAYAGLAYHASIGNLKLGTYSEDKFDDMDGKQAHFAVVEGEVTAAQFAEAYRLGPSAPVGNPLVGTL